MSDPAEPSPQGRDATDPWAAPDRARAPMDLGKRVPVHDQPTITSIPAGDAAGAELPPPPVAPGGPAAYGAPTPPPGYGYPPGAAGSTGYGYPPGPAASTGYGHPAGGPGTSYGHPAAGAPTGAYGYPAVRPRPYLPVPGQNNGMGTAGMVLGIIGTCLFWFYGIPSIVLGVLGLIFGVIGRKRANRGEASNGGAATAGIVLGVVSTVLGAAVVALIAWAVVWGEEYQGSDSGERTSATVVADTRR